MHKVLLWIPRCFEDLLQRHIVQEKTVENEMLSNSTVLKQAQCKHIQTRNLRVNNKFLQYKAEGWFMNLDATVTSEAGGGKPYLGTLCVLFSGLGKDPSCVIFPLIDFFSAAK